MKKLFLSLFLPLVLCFAPKVANAVENDNLPNIKTYESSYSYKNGQEHFEKIETNLKNNQIDMSQTISHNGEKTKDIKNKIEINNKEAQDYVQTLKEKMNVDSVFNDFRTNFDFLDYNKYFDKTFKTITDEKPLLQIVIHTYRKGNSNNQNDANNNNTITNNSTDSSTNDQSNANANSSTNDQSNSNANSSTNDQSNANIIDNNASKEDETDNKKVVEKKPINRRPRTKNNRDFSRNLYSSQKVDATNGNQKSISVENIRNYNDFKTKYLLKSKSL